MTKEIITIEQAAREWFNGFSAIPSAICEKLLKVSECELLEITPPSKCDRIFIFGGEHDGEWGEIVETGFEDDDDLYRVRLDDGGELATINRDDFEVENDGVLPMWGTLWAFGDSADNWWLDNDDGLQKMADCGFRIYEQEDYGFLFGIDGAGYDFYEQHWIPLYKARGLHWHSQPDDHGQG